MKRNISDDRIPNDHLCHDAKGLSTYLCIDSHFIGAVSAKYLRKVVSRQDCFRLKHPATESSTKINHNL